VPEFVPGLKLARSFYGEVVAPIIGSVPHAAALVGEGSEVLGFDSERSTDHSWGPRLHLFVDSAVVEQLQKQLVEDLPAEFAGWPVRFYSWRTGRVEHHVEVSTIVDWLQTLLGFDPREGISVEQWLTTSQQVLLQATSGAVLHDDSGELTRIRELLRWYPMDVWLWLMACQWNLIARAEVLIGRTGEAGDSLGSQLAAGQLARDLVRLCCLQERQYAPYEKWLGTAFSRLRAAETVDVLGLASATRLTDRERSLVSCVEAVAQRHNELGLTVALDTTTDHFDVGIAGAHRPYRVLNARRFAKACQEAIKDDRLRGLELVGSIDQLTIASDLLINFTDWPRRLQRLYQERLRE
jgi:Domain of unknown function (DUF4037)